MKTLLLLLISISAFGQSLDTLFFKNFNDKSSSSNLPGGKGTFSMFGSNYITVTNGQDTANIGGTPSLMVDVRTSRLFRLLAAGGQSTQQIETVFGISIPNADFDSAKVSFQIKGDNIIFGTKGFEQKQSPLLPSNPYTVSLMYTNSVTQKLFSKNYSLNYSSPLQFFYGDNTYPISVENKTQKMATITTTQPISQTTYFGNLYYYMYTPVQIQVTSSGTHVGIQTEVGLRQFLLNNFCGTTDNVSNCLSITSIILPPFNNPNTPIDLNKNFLIDNILVLGKNKKLPTGLEETTQKPNQKKIISAYSLLGQEIVNFENYVGAAIVVYSDGSRAKIIK